MRLLSRADAQAVDDALMSGDVGFSLAQLMELAGLSVACAVRAALPPQSAPNILVVCGPGESSPSTVRGGASQVVFG